MESICTCCNKEADCAKRSPAADGCRDLRPKSGVALPAAAPDRAPTPALPVEGDPGKSAAP